MPLYHKGIKIDIPYVTALCKLVAIWFPDMSRRNSVYVITLEPRSILPTFFAVNNDAQWPLRCQRQIYLHQTEACRRSVQDTIYPIMSRALPSDRFVQLHIQCPSRVLEQTEIIFLQSSKIIIFILNYIRKQYGSRSGQTKL